MVLAGKTAGAQLEVANRAGRAMDQLAQLRQHNAMLALGDAS
jgi:hypothetical protein